MSKKLNPVTPGEILLKEFMEPLEISQNKLARDIDVPVARINDIIHDRRGITADTAVRLGAYFETSAELWINLQSRYDLKKARAILAPRLDTTIRPLNRDNHANQG